IRDLNICFRQRPSQLGARELLPIAQRLRQHGSAPPRKSVIHLEPAIPVRVGCMDPWCGESQHPVDVGSSDEVPRRAQDVGANYASVVDLPLDPSVGETGSALSDSPLGCSVILCLHGAECRYDRAWSLQRGLDESLVDQTLSGDVWLGHGSIIVYVADRPLV